MTRRKFIAKFKTKVVLEVLKERSSLSELAQKYDTMPQQLFSRPLKSHFQFSYKNQREILVYCIGLYPEPKSFGA